MNKSDIPNAKASKADETLRMWCVEQATALCQKNFQMQGFGEVTYTDHIALARKIEDYVRGRITTP